MQILWIRQEMLGILVLHFFCQLFSCDGWIINCKAEAFPLTPMAVSIPKLWLSAEFKGGEELRCGVFFSWLDQCVTFSYRIHMCSESSQSWHKRSSLAFLVLVILSTTNRTPDAGLLHIQSLSVFMSGVLNS